LKILAISFLFPNCEQPNHGIFVKNRLEAVSKYAEVKMINPIAWSPMHGRIRKFKDKKNIPLVEVIGGIEVYHPRFFSIPKLFKSIETLTYYRAVLPLVKQLYKSFKFDLIDLHWTYPDLPTGYFLSKQFNTPFMVTLRGKEAFHLEDGGLRKHIISHYLKKTSQAIALSQELKNINQQLTKNAITTAVIRNGVDTDNFYYLPMTECRKALMLSNNEKIIVMVGSLIYRKGFDLVIDALAQIIKENLFSNIKLYIIGSEGPEGDYRKSLFAQVKQLNLKDHVVFKGQVANSQLKIWYNAANLFCLSSRGEGSPNVLTESLACGCPVVATDVGAVNEIMSSEEGIGACIQSESIIAISNGLKSVLSSQYDRNKNAKLFKKYNWDWCAQNVIKIYRALV